MKAVVVRTHSGYNKHGSYGIVGAVSKLSLNIVVSVGSGVEVIEIEMASMAHSSKPSPVFDS